MEPDANNPLIEPQVYCAHTEMVAVDSLVENPRNPNRHPQNQIVLLSRIIRHQGWRNPIVVSNRSGFVVKGHGRLMAAKLLGVASVPVDYQDYANEAAEWADMVADNKIAELSETDGNALKSIIRELDGQIDLDLTGFEQTELDDILADVPDDVPEEMALEAEKTASSTQAHLAYGNKKFYMQDDEVDRFERFMKAYFRRNGNGVGLVMELLEHGDSRYQEEN